MKLNKISMVIAAMAFVGCSSDDFNLSSNKTVDESGMIQLDENFVIAGVGEEDAATRTHWEWDDPIAKTALVNKFLPIYDGAATFAANLDDDADLTAQEVGLCWLGNGAVGTDVYTNYEFYHFGWLKNGETKAKYVCELENGAMYDEIVTAGGTTAPAAGQEAKTTDWAPGGLPGKALKAGADDLNYNSGVYKTDNKAIFGGQYIVYYPYNEDFKEAGTIPAIAETTFNPAATDFEDATIGKATFRYSAPVEIKGGDQAADFGLYNLSSLAQLRVACPAGGDLAVGQTIDQIVLYSPSEQLLKQANLAADKIAAGKKGADLYASTEGTKTIVANFSGVPAFPALNVTTGAVTSAYITVLPTTVDDLVALVHSNTLNQWARIPLGSTVFEAGKAKRVDITVSRANFQYDFIAVDEASLTQALNDARLTITGPASKASIEVIGDITLKAATINPTTVFAAGTYSITNPADAQITIKGGDIIVPEDVTLELNTNMQSKVRVLGKSCCKGAKGGRLDIQGGTVSDVTMEPTQAAANANNNPEVNYFGVATVAAGKTFDVQAGAVKVWNKVEHKGDINLAAGATLTVYGGGDLNFMGSTVVNNGTIEVMKYGKFDMTDADGNATASDGQRMTNNGTFIHNVDAGVGTAVQSMHQNGEYRCRVDDQIKLDDAFLQWTACSVIEMVNAGPISYDLVNASQISTPFKHKGDYINIEVNTPGVITTFNNNSHDDLNIQIKNLTVTRGQLDINIVDPVVVGTKWQGYRALTVNGNMTVKDFTRIMTSEKITVTNNVNVQGAQLYYKGGNYPALAGHPTILNNKGFAVAKNITVSRGAGNFNASDIDALNITCANFTLSGGARADFGNRTGGASKNMVVNGTINNGEGCTFNIIAANQVGTSVLAWVSCKQLIATGNFPGSKPRVE